MKKLTQKERQTLAAFNQLGGTLNYTDFDRKNPCESDSRIFIMDDGELQDSFNSRGEVDTEFLKIDTLEEWSEFLTKTAFYKLNTNTEDLMDLDSYIESFDLDMFDEDEVQELKDMFECMRTCPVGTIKADSWER